MGLQPTPQFQIHLRPATPRVYQDYRQAESLALQEVALNQAFPLPRYFPGDFSEPISWQVDKPEAPHLEEVDQLRAARPGTDRGQPAGPHQRIQEAGFADVAAAQKRDFRLRFGRKLLRPGCTYYKPRRHTRGQGQDARARESVTYPWSLAPDP